MNEFYVTYQVKEGETLHSIATRHKANISGIITANPLINPFFLKENSFLIIPIKNEVVTAKNYYDFDTFKRQLMALKVYYPFLETNILGLSHGLRELYCVTFGKGNHTVLFNGSHHGNEYITSIILMKWLENLCYAMSLKGSMKGYNIEDIFQNYKIVLVPMVNPDGVDLVIHGLKSVDSGKERLLFLNNNNKEFSGWKANLNGVDINRNYDAGWKTYKNKEPDFGINGPGPFGFSGFSPQSEPETRCLINLTNKLKPRLTLSYHSQGEEIFWKFSNRVTREGQQIAEKLSEICGYKLSDELENQSYAGYKDWFIQKYSRPGFTIEVGKGQNPIPLSNIDKIYEENEELLLFSSVI